MRGTTNGSAGYAGMESMPIRRHGNPNCNAWIQVKLGSSWFACGTAGMIRLTQDGSCPLKAADAAVIVAESLAHFDNQRYLLLDWVIMPNHVHALAVFPDEQSMLTQCDSWKHFTAARLNKLLGRSGRFWQVDGFDHLVRSEEQFEYLRRYIAENPRRAGLRAGEYLHYSRMLKLP